MGICVGIVDGIVEVHAIADFELVMYSRRFVQPHGATRDSCNKVLLVVERQSGEVRVKQAMKVVDVGIAIPVNREWKAVVVLAGVKVYGQTPLSQVANAAHRHRFLSRLADSS